MRKKPLHKKPDPDSPWVFWLKLLNKSRHQTVAELREFLISKGLYSEGLATQKALASGIAMYINGAIRWNRDKYKILLENHNKYVKLVSKGKEVHPAILRRAMVDPM
jgi:hypothetical protein